MFSKPLLVLLLSLLLFSCHHKITEQISTEHIDSTGQVNIKSWLQYTDKIYVSNIRSLKLIINNDNYPIWILNKSKNLTINFDILGNQKKDYQIAVIRCDIDWETSLKTVYKDVLMRYNIENLYDSYTFDLANTDFTFKESGNYLIIVFEKYSTQPIISKRFLVSEDKLILSGNIQKPILNENRSRYQNIQYKVDLNNFTTNDPFEDFKTVIVQNWQWQNIISNNSPSIIQDNKLIYDYPKQNLLLGGKPYRQITLTEKTLQVNDEPRSFKKYQNSIDNNGLFFIKENAVYAKTTFNLNLASPLNNEEHIYVYGELSNWNINPDFKLKFDSIAHTYNTSVFLKKGIYDYQYALVQDNKTIDLNFIEGSSYMTTNKYHILVYHKTADTYRLLTIKTIN